MLRGIDRTQLFYDDKDYEAFLNRIRRLKDECGFGLLAYCLMGNHVHLLVDERGADVSEVVKRLATSYAHYFNRRYDRSGYLFEGRFKSEPVESDEYLFSVSVYIHNNPAAAGLPANLWTSYEEIVCAGPASLVDVGKARMALGISGDRPKQTLDSLLSKRAGEDCRFLGENSRRVSDSEAIAIIKEATDVKHCADLAKRDRQERNQALAMLKSQGLSIRQISRLTGINRSIVLKAGK
jgi:REP element-mobilizing transposase RayT